MGGEQVQKERAASHEPPRSQGLGLPAQTWRKRSRLHAFAGLIAFAFVFLTLSAFADQRSFLLNGTLVTLDEVTSEVVPAYQSTRFIRAANAWNIDVCLNNTGARVLPGPMVLVVESYSATTGPLQPDGYLAATPPRAFYDLSAQLSGGQLWPGEKSGLRTLALGYTNGSPELVARVYARLSALPPGLAQTRTLNPFGQPLPGVDVVETGPLGVSNRVTDSVLGLVTLGQGDGAHTWRFSRTGYLPVWRTRTLNPGDAVLVPTPRLTPQAASVTVPLAGGEVSNRMVRAVFAPGSLPQPTAVRLTPLSSQTLPAFLPIGWSPLQAFWLEADAAPLAPVTIQSGLWGDLLNGEMAMVARWDAAALSWQAARTLTGAGTNQSTFTVATTGAYAVVVRDTGSGAPALPAIGQPLPAGTLPLPSTATLTAGGRVSPGVSLPSRIPELVTAAASVTVTNQAGDMPSGVLLRCEVGESYQLTDGSRRRPPLYENFITGYRRPAPVGSAVGVSILNAGFPLQPLLLFGADELDLATVHVDVLPPGQLTGRLLDRAGGQVTIGGVTLVAAPGDLFDRQVVQVRNVDPTNYLEAAGYPMVAAFDVSLTGLAPGRHLALQVPSLASNAVYVLARVLAQGGFYGWEPVERFLTSATGVLTSAEPATGERLPGIKGAGQYLLLKAGSPLGLVTGIARNVAGQPTGGLPVSIIGQPWLTFSAANGAYHLVAPAGALQVAVADPASGDRALAAATVANAGVVTTVDVRASLQGPRVIAVTPANGSVNVSRVTAITVEFSEPINPVILAQNGVRLFNAGGGVVNLSATLNQRNTIVTLLPAAELAAGTNYTVRLSPDIADVTGTRLEGAAEFTFTTLREVARPEAAQLTIFEPGATNIPANVRSQLVGYDPQRHRSSVVAYGSPGTAEAEVAVILVNETSGETATVLSKPDGSFAGFVRGGEEDVVSAVFVNGNGTRNTVSASRQRFDDGRVGLYHSGGVLEAQADGGLVQVLVAPGAIENRTRFAMETLSLTRVLGVLGDVRPPEGKILGGLAYREELEPVNAAVEVSFPVLVADLGLPPGTDPKLASYGLTVPMEVDGKKVFHLIDTMEFEDSGAGKGRLVTHSPPFVGLLLRQIEQMRRVTGASDLAARLAGSADGEGAFEVQSVLQTALVVMLLAPVPPVKIAGKVLARSKGDSPDAASESTPVAGAYVSFRRESNLASSLVPGDVFAISDREGHYALAGRMGISISGSLVATHPAYPLQEPRIPVAALVTSKDLYFEKEQIPATGLTDTIAPELRVTQTPRFAVAGTLADDGGVLEITAIDDFRVGEIRIQPESYRTLGGDAPLDMSLVQRPELVGQIPGDQSRVLQRYRVRAVQPGRVEYSISVSDFSGNLTTVLYPVTFRSGPGGSAEPINRLIFVWPPNGATNIPASTPVLLRFADPLSAEQLAKSDWLGLEKNSPFRVTRMVPSSDRRELTVYFANGAGVIGSGLELKLTIGTEFVRFLATTDDKPGAFNYHVAFADPSKSISVDQAGASAVSGRGTVLVGNYIYFLGARGDEGVVRQYRFVNANGGVALGLVPDSEQVFPGYPTEFVHIPSYALRRQTGETISPAHYLAVFTGQSTDTKSVRVFRLDPVTGAIGPAEEGAGVISSAPAQIVKAKWDAPFAAFLELGADVTAVRLMNFNALMVGLQNQAAGNPLSVFPTDGSGGVDLNNDGDFADAGERAPLPSGRTGAGLGVEFSWAPSNPDDRMVDFDFSADFSLMPVAVRGLNGRPNAVVMALGGGGGILDDQTARITFPEEPKRVMLLLRQKLLVPQGLEISEIEGDLAIVSTAVPSGQTSGLLLVIDVSDARRPVIRGRAPMPAGVGSLNSIVRREDGLLSVASANGGLIVLDPRLLLLVEPGADGFTAAIQTTAGGLGGGVRTFVADDSGWNVTASSTEPRVAFTRPDIRVVTFTNAPFVPDSLLTDGGRPLGVGTGDDGLTSLFESARSVESPKIGQMETDLGAGNPESHLYVLVRAPGVMGEKLELAAAAIDSVGQPLLPAKDLVVPTFLGEEKYTTRYLLLAALEVLKHASLSGSLPSVLKGIAGGTLKVMLLNLWKSVRENKPDYSSTLTARRLSDDPLSPHYNAYLAGPIVLLKTDVSKSRYEELDNTDGVEGSMRRYLRASTYFWVGLSSQVGSDSVLGAFSSQQIEVIEASLDLSFGNFFKLGVAAGTALLGDPGELPSAVVNFVDARLKRILQPGMNTLVNVGCIRRPLIVIPGVMGSRLRSESDEIWLRPGNVRDRTSFGKLVLNSDGSGAPVQAYDMFDALDLLKTKKLKDAGRSLLQYLEGELGYNRYEFEKENEEASMGIGGGTPNLKSLERMPDLFVFPYDWRRNNEEAATRLAKYADLIRKYHPEGDKVDIIAHSMGGLVSRRFILDHPRRVDRLITICSPFLGATKAVSAKRLGNFDDLALNLAVPQDIMKQIARHNPALDQLMPSRALFNLGLRPVAENGWDADDDGLPFESYEYDDYKRVLDGFLFHARAGEYENPGMYPDPIPIGGEINNEAFHSFGSPADNQDDWRNDVSGTRYVHIVGLQRNADTISRIRLTPGLRELDSEEGSDIGLGFPPLSFADTERTDVDIPIAPETPSQFPSSGRTALLNLDLLLDRGPGDGTVPFLSQTRAFGSSRSLNAPGALMIPVLSNGPESENEEGAGHVGILSDARCLNWLGRVLREEVTAQTMARLTITPSATSLVEGGTITFAASGSGLPVGVSFAERDFIWDTGDGGMFVGNHGNHRYAEDGTYVLTCVASTADGRFAAIASVLIDVANGPPVVRFETPPATVTVGQLAKFPTQVNDPGIRDAHSFAWDFGDDSDVTDIPRDAIVGRHVFRDPGSYRVTVRVTDEDGAASTVTQNVQVVPAGVAQPSTTPEPRFVAQGGGGPTLPDGSPLPVYDEVVLTVRGHTSLVDDLKIISDQSPVQVFVESVMRFAQGLLLPVGLSTEAIVVRREPAKTGGDEPKETDVELKSAGSAVTLDASFKFKTGTTRCFRWLVPAIRGQTVRLAIKWADVMTWPEETLTTHTEPSARSAQFKNCLDDRGPAQTIVRDETTQEIEIFRDDTAIDDHDVTTLDGDPTDMDTVEDSTVPDPHSDTLVAQLDSTDPCAQTENLLAVSLTTGRVPVTSASGTPHLVVTKDRQGNLTVSSGLHHPICGDTSGTEDFTAIRNEIMAIFRETVTARGGTEALVAAPTAQNFLLSIDDLWLFEQGSGAALWKGDDAACAKVYKRGQSDNDYELLLPLWKSSPPDWEPADPAQAAEFLRRSHDPDFMEGNWYFRQPKGVVRVGQRSEVLQEAPDVDDLAEFRLFATNAVTHWKYQPPPPGVPTMAGHSTAFLIPAEGFFKYPRTPADAISYFMQQAARSTPFRKRTFPSISFFTFRRENFLFAVPSLDRPTPIGSDPIGDAGMGRGFLCLKWILEGSFLPPFPSGVSGIQFNSTVAPDGLSIRNEVFDRLNARRGSLAVESYEWGVLQEFGMLEASLLLRVWARNSVDLNLRNDCRKVFGDFLGQQDSVALRKAAKAGLRGLLACMARTPAALDDMFALDPAEFEAGHVPSFEHYVASVAKRHLNVLGGLTAPEIDEWVALKTGDRRVVEQILARQNGVENVVLNVLEFLRGIQQGAAPDFLETLSQLEDEGRVDEAKRRRDNAYAIDYGFTRADRGPAAGRLAMHGKPPIAEQSHKSKFTFYVNLLNATRTATGPLTLRLDTPGAESKVYPEPIYFEAGESTKRLWDETGLSPFEIERDPVNGGAVVHTFTLSGLAMNDLVPFNDQASFESRFLDPPVFKDDSLRSAGSTLWVYRGISANNGSFSAVIQQLSEGHLLASAFFVNGSINPNIDFEAVRQAELQEIQSKIDNPDPNIVVNPEFDDADVARMPDNEKLAVNHIPIPTPVAVSTSESQTLALSGFSSGTISLMVALEVDRQDAGIKYVHLPRQGRDGERINIPVRVNRAESERIFLREVKFKRAILYEVERVNLPNGASQFILTSIGDFSR